MSAIGVTRARSILYLDAVTVSFDGFKALNGLSLYLKPGELRAVIGPNGAGKTTMMDVITGKIKPDEGQVFFKESIDLTGYDEAAIANLGIGRKFQKPTVIESLTVLENLELALSGDRSVWKSLCYRRDESSSARIEDSLKTIRLGHRREWLAGSLSHGQKQWLEIGMLLIQEPDVMLVDEPAAGMSDEETALTADLLKAISGTRTVVVVEHDMEFVRALDCTVTVMHEGRMLAEGSLQHVQQDERVIEVYLGR
jgi:urea transport system ATP-binding protein